MHYYFSNPFSTRKCCVSVIDICSKVFDEIGIVWDIGFIRHCDINCVKAFGGEFVVLAIVSFVFIDEQDDCDDDSAK